MSRRRLLVRTGIGLIGAALAGAGGTTAVLDLDPALAPGSRHAAASGPATTGPFRSRPDLSPPAIQMSEVEVVDDGKLFFLTPNLGPAARGSGQPGLMILDGRGRLVWSQPLEGAFTNLQVQTYKGAPVLTWWEGTFEISAGFGRGQAVIADTSYHQIATVQAAGGLEADLHEFVLTPEGTALITSFPTAAADLTRLGGPRRAEVYEGVVQEIDVATGRLLFEWRSLDHVPVEESYAELGEYPFDYFHVNSIGVDPDDGHLLVSARNTWALYKIHRRTGAVIWRIGGKRSDFEQGPGAKFFWQHHARPHGGGVVSIFDDGASPAEETQSRAIKLQLDTSTMRATLTKAFTHPAHLLAENQGSVQLMPDGGAVVGWGSEPYFSQFASDGLLVRDGRMPTNNESYRAFLSNWTAHPRRAPDIAVDADDVGGHTVYASWNGATEIATWRVLAGSHPVDLAPVASAPKAGFETAITVHTDADMVAVQALDRLGRNLGKSKAISL